MVTFVCIELVVLFCDLLEPHNLKALQGSWSLSNLPTLHFTDQEDTSFMGDQN